MLPIPGPLARILPSPSRLVRSSARAAGRLAALALALAVLSPAQAQGDRAVDDARAEADFDAARELVDGGLYGPAARALARFQAEHPASPHAPEALYLEGQARLATGDAEGAAARFVAFERAFPTHPLAPRARLAVGRYLYATGDDAGAEDALLAALARDLPPASAAEAEYLLGQVALRQGRPDAAAQAFERAAAAPTPTAPLALYAAGATRASLGQHDAAARAYTALADTYPASPQNLDARLALAEALLRTGDLAGAEAELVARRPTLTGDDAARADLLLGETRLRLGDAAGAEAPLRAVPPASPYARRAALALGRRAFDADAWADAVTFFAAARAPVADAAQDDAVAHEAVYYEGLALKALGQLGEAERRLSAAHLRLPSGAYAEPALLELGLLHYERRRYADAADALGQLLSAAPQGPYTGEAARMLGESYAALGETELARQAFARAETLGTATAETRAEVDFQDAYGRFRRGEYADAPPALLRVAAEYPDSPRAPEALFWAGEAAFRDGRYARAQEILEGYLARYPGHRQADAGRYVLAWTHFRRRDYASAAAAFERFLSAYQRGQAELVPYYADALLRLGDSYYALRRFGEARRVYALVEAATPTRQGADYALFQTALAHNGQGQAAEATAALTRLVDEYPTSDLLDEALIARAELRFARADYPAALADYQRVVAERPESGSAARALVGQGDIAFNQEDFAAAEAAYRRVLDRYPASPFAADALAGLSYTLDATGRADEYPALLAAVEARATDPASLARIRLARAEAALAAGDAQSAADVLGQMLGAGPPPEFEAEGLLALGGALAALDRPADAAAPLRRLLARHGASPFAPEAALQLIEVLLAAGDAPGALAETDRYPTAYPDDAERVATALALRADALVALGRSDEADDALRRLLRDYGGTTVAQGVAQRRPELVPPPEPSPDDDAGPDDAPTSDG